MLLYYHFFDMSIKNTKNTEIQVILRQFYPLIFHFRDIIFIILWREVIFQG